ncbi:MAG: hypothetical protein FWC51_01285 [Proteobacteria bacterium]|nr:hypothetical protein [Pseudomonadota bacterium]
MKKYLLFALCSLLFAACSSPNAGTIDNATILNWENEMVTTDRFVHDHKYCLGITDPSYAPQSRLAKLLMPNSGNQMPDWNGLWVTFQSNEATETGQRVLMSIPPNTASKSIGAYRKCMFQKGYLLRAA